jgi:hypothetical protein
MTIDSMLRALASSDFHLKRGDIQTLQVAKYDRRHYVIGPADSELSLKWDFEKDPRAHFNFIMGGGDQDYVSLNIKNSANGGEEWYAVTVYFRAALLPALQSPEGPELTYFRIPFNEFFNIEPLVQS